jgi:olefin beta-lactone synthetase
MNSYRKTSLGQLISTTINKSDSSPVITFAHNEESISGADLQLLIQDYARELVNYSTGNKVLILSGVNKHTLAFMVAAMHTGVIPLLINPGFGLINAIRIIQSMKPRLAFIGENPSLLKNGLISLFFSIVKKRMPVFSEVAERIVSTAFISFSSGSSGTPKAIVRTHDKLLAQHAALNRCFPPMANQVDCSIFPAVIFHNLCNGTPMVLPSVHFKDIRKSSAATIASDIQRHKVTTISANPAFYQILISHGRNNNKLTFPGVLKTVVGGAPVNNALARGITDLFPNAENFVLYGSTEAEPISLLPLPEVIDAQENNNGYCVGRVATGTEVQLLHPDTGKVTDEVGEVMVRGEHVIMPSGVTSNQVFTDHENRQWLKTGDMGYFSKDGLVFLVGNTRNYFNISGIFPYELEKQLDQFPGVTRSAAFVKNNVLRIVIEGSVNSEQAIKRILPSTIQHNITSIESMPVDRRHRSKIDYLKLMDGK